MNKLLQILSIIILIISCKTQDASVQTMPIEKTIPVVEFSGLYIGKNVYVQNPFRGTGVGFCIDSIIVNDTLKFKQITSSVVEITLDMFEKCVDTLAIKMYHCSDCLPKVLGPELITPKLTTEFESISIDENGLLSWKTKNESWIGNFSIQRFEDTIWHLEKTLVSKGGECFRNNEYFETVNLNKGVNTFRIVKHLSAQHVFSNTVTIEK